MKLKHCVFACLCLSAVAQGKNQNAEDRFVKSPQCFVKAGAFAEMKDVDRMLYTNGLMDGFFASAFWGASDNTVAALNSCTRGMDSKQLSAIIGKYVQDHPETWHLPLSVEAFNALRATCPDGLKVINEKK